MSLTLLAAGIGSLAAGIFGKQKAAPSATPPKVSIADAASDAANANAKNFDQNADLSRRQNDFAQSEATRLLDKAIPGFSGLQAKLLEGINSDLNSQDSLPTEVSDNIARLAAEKGITRGTSGGFNDFSLVRDFGFNLVDWKNAQRARALSTLSTVYGMAPRINPMTPMASFVDPNTALRVQSDNEQSRYNSEQSKMNADAAADNANRSIWGSVANIAIQAGAGVLKASGGGGGGSTGDDNAFNRNSQLGLV